MSQAPPPHGAPAYVAGSAPVAYPVLATPQPVMVQPVPPQASTMAFALPTTSPSYQPAVFQGPAPAPLAAVQAPLPSLRLAAKEQQQREDHAKTAASLDQKTQAQSTKTGLFGKLGHVAMKGIQVAEKVTHQVTVAATQAWNGKVSDESLARFALLAFPPEERLIGDFHCHLVTGQHEAKGWLFVSQYFLTYEGRIDKAHTKSPQDTPVRVVIPLSSILSCRVGVATAYGAAQPRQVALNPGPDVPNNKAPGVKQPYYNALLVYTNNGQVHTFYNFLHFSLDWFDDMFNVLDHAVRGDIPAAALFATKTAAPQHPYVGTQPGGPPPGQPQGFPQQQAGFAQPQAQQPQQQAQMYPQQPAQAPAYYQQQQAQVYPQQQAQVFPQQQQPPAAYQPNPQQGSAPPY